MRLDLHLFLILLAPLPRPAVEADITDAELLAHVWLMEWNCTRQTCEFWQDGQNYYHSPQFGGGSFTLGKGGRVEFEEGANRYVMILRRNADGLVGSGWRVWDDGTKGGEVVVIMKPKREPMQ